MADKFCEPCQAVLRGETREIETESSCEYCYAHHDTAESFQSALEHPCAICVRLWAVIRRRYHNQKSILPASPTTIITCIYSRPTFYFEYEGKHTNFDLRPWTATPRHLVAPFSKNTGDDIALGFLSKTNQRCLQYHTSCRAQRQGRDFLPTRLIDVGGTADLSVRLRERILPNAGVRYAVLSHCWGNCQPVTLSKLTADLLRNGIAVTALPKTFQDAIVVTRSMQCRFLWIDSLCILQDDHDDWLRESAAMRDVYSNAAVCIAATAAEDGNTGLFFDRDMEVMTPVKVEFSRTIYAGHGTSLDHPCGSYMLQFERHYRSQVIDRAPLNDRAWVAQERFLSRRIIHFTHDLLFWECQESFTSETYANDHPDLFEEEFGVRSLKTLLAKYASSSFANGDNAIRRDTDPHDAYEIYSRWRLFLEFYTSCKLTMGTDVLVALDGVSREIAAILQDEMIAGLWKGHLLSELCWHKYHDKPCRPPFPSAPSWSWTSTTGPIIAGHDYGHWSSMAEVQDARVDLAPSGAFERAFLTLRCRTIPISLRGSTARNALDYINKLSHFEAHTYLDRAVHPDDSVLVDLDAYVLLLQYDSNREVAEGIIVVPCQDHPGGYKRVAFCRLFVPSNLYDDDERERARTIPEVIEELAELQTIELF